MISKPKHPVKRRANPSSSPTRAAATHPACFRPPDAFAYLPVACAFANLILPSFLPPLLASERSIPVFYSGRSLISKIGTEVVWRQPQPGAIIIPVSYTHLTLPTKR